MNQLPRVGLRIRCRQIDPEVRQAILDFVKWLRAQIDFSVRVVIYLSSAKRIKNMSGELVTATFFAPYDKNVEPYIRAATGDYIDLERKWGRDEALAAILHSIAHEVAHYEQWLSDKDLSCRSARSRASRLIKAYAETREHP